MHTGPAILDQEPDTATADTAEAGALSSGTHGTQDREPQPVSFGVLLREIWEGAWAREEWTPPAVLRLMWVFCFATLCSWAGIVLSRQSEGVVTIWFSNGVIFGLLITQSPRRWLPYFAAGLAADTFADLIYGDRFALAIGVSVANSVEVVSSALLLTWLFGRPFDLSRHRALVGFLGVSVVGATALSSLLGASWTLLFQQVGPSWQLYRAWWLGDMLGMAVLVPPIVMLHRSASYAILRPSQLRHTLLVLMVPVLATVAVFTHQRDPLIFFLFPPLLLVAFRLGLPGTVLAIVVVTLLAIGFTVKGYGPLMLIPGEHAMLRRIVVAQILAAVAIFTMFPVAAVLEERAALQRSLAASETRYKLLAETDALTGLANRRAFNLSLMTEWEIASLNRTSLGLLLVDADHFKQYNDVFGHLEGDECLRSLAETLTMALAGQTALVARYGGEEFAVLLPGADEEQVLRLAKRLCTAVTEKRLPHPTGPCGVQTVSVGACSLVPGREQRSELLVRRADEALYCAKLSGRNQAARV